MNPEELKTKIFLGSKIVNKKTGVETVIKDLALVRDFEKHTTYLIYTTDIGEIDGREIDEWERVR